MNKRDISIEELIGKVKSKEITLPEIQRRYVWTSTKVRDLLDSLYRGYPTGTILVWENHGQDQPSRNLDVDITPSQSAISTNLMLLDGQQRLTSLTALMTGEQVKVKNSKRPIEIMFNLEHPDEFSRAESEDTDDEDEENEEHLEQDYKFTDEDKLNLKKFIFVVYSRALENKKEWIKVTDIFKKSSVQILREMGLQLDDKNCGKYIGRIEKVQNIKRYPYVMNVLNKEYTYDEVTEIFVRVNSAGAKLRSSDLALAQITSKWLGCLKIFEQFISEKREENFDVNMTSLVRSLVVYATGQCKFQTVGSLSLRQIKEAWEKTKDGLDYALNFLRNNTAIEDLGLLSSPFIIIPVSYFSSLKQENLNAQEEKDLVKWIYLSNAFSNYSGSSESTLNTELNILKKGGNIKALINLIERKNGRIQISADDLKGKRRKSPLFAMAYMATRKNNAKDWFTGIGVSKGTKGKFHRIQSHHIFPKKVLQDAQYSQSEINEIANLSFISGRTNRKISARKPENYFRNIIDKQGKETLQHQFIPVEDENLWKVENFPKFLEKRREMLAEAVNKLLVA